MKVVENIVLRDTAGDTADITPAGALKVDASAAPQPVTDNGASLTIDAVSLPLPTGAATETTLDAIKTAVELIDNAISGNEIQADIVGALPPGSNTIGAVTITDGVDSPDVLPLTNNNGLAVAILDTNGDQVNTFGGREYQEGTVEANITGGVAMMEGAGNTILPIQGTVADGLLVNLGSNNDVTVTGSVTANAGTNLNTSALALETTVQSIKTAVETIDNAINGAEMQVDVITMPTVTVAQSTASSLKAQAHLIDSTGDSITDDSTDSLRVNIVAGSSSGTEYTEDVPATSNPSGGMTMVVREDSLTAVTDTNNDNIALRGTNKGELYVKQTDVVSIDDNGASITVDGTITANQGGTWNINNISGSINLPTGASSLGEQQTQTNLLTTIDGDTSNISTKIDTIAGAVSGTEVQVDIITIPPVTATDLDIRDLSQNQDSVLIYGSDDGGTTKRVIKTDLGGAVQVDIESGNVTVTNSFALEATLQSVKTAVETLDNTVSGNELQVDVLTMPTVTVQAADLDIRNLTSTDVVTAELSATDNAVLDAIALSVAAEKDATKTVGTNVMPLQTVAASSVAISSTISVASKLSAKFYIHFGREAATAAGAGVNIRIESSSKSSGDGHWYTEVPFTTNFAAVSDEAVSGTEAAGQTVISVASTTGLTAGDIVFFFNSTVGNSEWHRVKSIVTNTSITLEDALVNAQTGSTIYDGAEMFVAQLDLTAGSRYRVVADGSLFTQAFAIEVDMITWDSVGNV